MIMFGTAHRDIVEAAYSGHPLIASKRTSLVAKLLRKPPCAAAAACRRSQVHEQVGLAVLPLQAPRSVRCMQTLIGRLDLQGVMPQGCAFDITMSDSLAIQTAVDGSPLPHEHTAATTLVEWLSDGRVPCHKLSLSIEVKRRKRARAGRQQYLGAFAPTAQQWMWQGDGANADQQHDAQDSALHHPLMAALLTLSSPSGGIHFTWQWPILAIQAEAGVVWHWSARQCLQQQGR